MRSEKKLRNETEKKKDFFCTVIIYSYLRWISLLPSSLHNKISRFPNIHLFLKEAPGYLETYTKLTKDKHTKKKYSIYPSLSFCFIILPYKSRDLYRQGRMLINPEKDIFTHRKREC